MGQLAYFKVKSQSLGQPIQHREKKERAEEDCAYFSNTFFEDSVLMYASGEHAGRNYVAISLFGGQLHFEINFGDGPLNCTIGYSLNDEA
ncbi:hypothetical protein AVEN_127290-1 [Araneus ventricosus]|uniref:Laminin G domain-containing protein n=1 Tax=Araneus ventricosus TaxID=182803 RepID=A0A4Y2PPE4_ARAVE|nr:hypothetical protein AVEN_127290-1 [Araneus ventricosus]